MLLEIYKTTNYFFIFILFNKIKNANKNKRQYSINTKYLTILMSSSFDIKFCLKYSKLHVRSNQQKN